MAGQLPRPAARSVAVEELRNTVWIRVVPPTLDTSAASGIRRACLRSLERGSAHVVVELSGVDEVCTEAVDVLEAAAGALAAKQATLWLANTDDEGLKIGAVAGDDLSSVAGLSEALDASRRAAPRRLSAPTW